MGRPSLHLPRLQDMTTGPILLQLGESPSKPPETRAIIGLKASNQQIPISLSKPILKDHPQVKGQLTCMIHKYADVFTPKSEGKVGVTDLVQLELKLAPGPVVRQKTRHLNPAMKESLYHQIAEWFQNGVKT